MGLAFDADMPLIFKLRHQVYASELGQHSENALGKIRDPIDEYNLYLTVRKNDQLVGFISITPPLHLNSRSRNTSIVASTLSSTGMRFMSFVCLQSTRTNGVALSRRSCFTLQLDGCRRTVQVSVSAWDALRS